MKYNRPNGRRFIRKGAISPTSEETVWARVPPKVAKVYRAKLSTNTPLSVEIHFERAYSSRQSVGTTFNQLLEFK